jgi:formamidopyrimidine-DNA glycosylase
VPEILEIEYYRRTALPCVGRSIAAVSAPDDWFLKGTTTAEELGARLPGLEVSAVRRRGKLLLADLSDGSVLGLRFGMTGRLIVDDSPVIDRLEYAPNRDEPSWDRFGLAFGGGGSLRLQDPRRLGGVEIDPDEARLGPDAWELDGETLRRVLATSTAPLKARLMDQARLAGLGNLLTDEILWRAGLGPTREAGTLADAEIDRLGEEIGVTLDDLFERGGSHTGDLQEERHREGHCPLDGSPLTREQVGGRTTYWCAVHQR